MEEDEDHSNMPDEEELELWEDLIAEEINPQEFACAPFGSFYTTADPNGVFRMLYEYLKSHGVTPAVDEKYWRMEFVLPDEVFGEQLPEDPDFPKREEEVEPVTI